MGNNTSPGPTPPQNSSNTSPGPTPPQNSSNSSKGSTPPQNSSNTSPGPTPPQNSSNSSKGSTPPQNSSNTSTSSIPVKPPTTINNMNLLKSYNSILVKKNYNDNIPELLTRYNGGILDRPHPYIKGYWHLLMMVPDIISESNNENIFKRLNCYSESFTPPNRTLTKSEVIGFNGVKKQIITGQNIDNTFTITFREYSNQFIYNLFSKWTSVVNPFTGHIIDKYKGCCSIGLLKPTANLINEENKKLGLDKNCYENIYFFDGIFPETDPKGAFGVSIDSIEPVTIEITFSFDVFLIDKWFDFDKFVNDFNVLGDLPKPYNIL